MAFKLGVLPISQIYLEVVELIFCSWASLAEQSYFTIQRDLLSASSITASFYTSCIFLILSLSDS